MVKQCITATCFVMDNNKTLMMKHIKINKWMPPGGHVEPDETPIHALHREILEETGYEVNLIDTYDPNHDQRIIDPNAVEEIPVPLTIVLEHVKYKDDQHDHFDLVYVAAVDNSKEIVAAESSEDMKWFGREELDGLDTFLNVKLIGLRAFDAYDKFLNATRQ